MSGIERSPRSKTLGQLRLAEQSIEGGGHGGRVAGRNEQRILVVSQHLADSRQVGGDDGAHEHTTVSTDSEFRHSLARVCNQSGASRIEIVLEQSVCAPRLVAVRA